MEEKGGWRLSGIMWEDWGVDKKAERKAAKLTKKRSREMADRLEIASMMSDVSFSSRFSVLSARQPNPQEAK